MVLPAADILVVGHVVEDLLKGLIMILTVGTLIGEAVLWKDPNLFILQQYIIIKAAFDGIHCPFCWKNSF